MTATITPLGIKPQADKLRITEIFASIQGESLTVGRPTVFIRLTGCPLRCQYCDTAYAFSGGEWMQFEEITRKVARHNLKSCLSLLRKLCDQNFIVSLETSGALDISEVDPRVIKVMDIKTPASQEVTKNRWENIAYLREKDQVKFVICNQSDYVWAKNIVAEHQLQDRCEVLFSPMMEVVGSGIENFEAKHLAEWIVQDQLNVRFQLQIHKMLWGNSPGK